MQGENRIEVLSNQHPREMTIAPSGVTEFGLSICVVTKKLLVLRSFLFALNEVLHLDENGKHHRTAVGFCVEELSDFIAYFAFEIIFECRGFWI